MNSDRIREIQKSTGQENSVSITQALMQVWNECAQESRAEIGRKDELIEQMRVALAWLYNWTKVETERFQANTPDDEIIKDVEAALSAAERGE